MTTVPSVENLIRVLILLDETISTDRLLDELSEQFGRTPTKLAVSAIRREFLAALKLLNAFSLLRHRKIAARAWLNEQREVQRQTDDPSFPRSEHDEPQLKRKPKRRRPFKPWDLN